jgi:hypothetical protein
VSKIVDWGRWVLAASLTLEGVLHVVSEGQKSNPSLFDMFFAGAFFFFLVYGVLVWSKWAHGLLVVSGFLSVPLIAYLYVSGKAAEYGIQLLSPKYLMGDVLGCVELIWLLLPPVRAAYWHKERAAWAS